MSNQKNQNSTENFRLNLDELTPEQLYDRLKNLQNDAIREAGEAIAGGRDQAPPSAVVHAQIGGSFSSGTDSM